MRNKLILSVAGAAFSFATSGLAFAADMAVKAPPAPAPTPVLTWTGFYGGIQFGGGWSGDQGLNFSPNDPVAAQLASGTPPFFPGEQPLATRFGISQSGAVGGFEAGYNWQAGANWLLGLEADFSFSGMSGQATGPTSIFTTAVPAGASPIMQSLTANEQTDWYGTVRGRAGWLATPNLLLFGTGGFAYGRVAGSANYLLTAPGLGFNFSGGPIGGFGFNCAGIQAATCFAGSSSEIRTGWTAGGGVEWLLDQHWSAKIEYQFVDLGTETVRVTALSIAGLGGLGVTTPASFNAAFHDRFNVVRLGLNYRF
jgi:outer membrane immunogenic protein